MNTKKGVYRKTVVIEMLDDYSVLKKGTVTEVHPVLANRLIAIDKAKKSSKAATVQNLAPTSKINESKA